MNQKITSGMLSPVIATFRQKFPKIKEERAINLCNRYLAAIKKQVSKNLAYERGSVIMKFSTHEAMRDSGEFQYNNHRYYVWKEFESLLQIVVVWEKGSNLTNQLSQVRIDERYLDLLIETMDAAEIQNAWWGSNWNSADLSMIPVDVAGLEHFAVQCERELQKKHHPNYLNRVRQNLRVVKQVLVVVNSYNGRWPHLSKSSPYGRNYYVGLSLHNCSSEVRHAALGHHYSYDLDAACYAVRLLLVEDIFARANSDTLGLYTNTKDYLTHKSAIRRRLAQHIQHYPDGERLVKEALNAIGFGARLEEGSWLTAAGTREYNAISKIIRNSEDRERFMTDPWVIEFTREQEEMITIISEYYLTDDAFAEHLRTVPNMTNNRGTIKPNQVMAYLYQHMETQIIQHLTGDLEVTVTIHDGFIAKRRYNLLDLRVQLREISPYLDISVEEHIAFRTETDDELEHHEFIRQEEARVAQLAGKPVHRPQTRYWPRIRPFNSETSAWTGTSVGEPNYDPDLDPWLDQ